VEKQENNRKPHFTRRAASFILPAQRNGNRDWQTVTIVAE